LTNVKTEKKNVCFLFVYLNNFQSPGTPPAGEPYCGFDLFYGSSCGNELNITLRTRYPKYQCVYVSSASLFVMPGYSNFRSFRVVSDLSPVLLFQMFFFVVGLSWGFSWAWICCSGVCRHSLWRRSSCSNFNHHLVSESCSVSVLSWFFFVKYTNRCNSSFCQTPSYYTGGTTAVYSFCSSHKLGVSLLVLFCSIVLVIM
jgi:hypothetical protein